MVHSKSFPFHLFNSIVCNVYATSMSSPESSSEDEICNSVEKESNGNIKFVRLLANHKILFNKSHLQNN